MLLLGCTRLFVSHIHGKTLWRLDWSVPGRAPLCPTACDQSCQFPISQSRCTIILKQDSAQSRVMSLHRNVQQGSDWQSWNFSSSRLQSPRRSLSLKDKFTCDGAWSVSNARCARRWEGLDRIAAISIWLLGALTSVDFLGFWHTNPGFASEFWSTCSGSISCDTGSSQGSEPPPHLPDHFAWLPLLPPRHPPPPLDYSNSLLTGLLIPPLSPWVHSPHAEEWSRNDTTHSQIIALLCAKSFSLRVTIGLHNTLQGPVIGPVGNSLVSSPAIFILTDNPGNFAPQTRPDSASERLYLLFICLKHSLTFTEPETCTPTLSYFSPQYLSPSNILCIVCTVCLPLPARIWSPWK